jgi:DNA-binding NtrC family response regulator
VARGIVWLVSAKHGDDVTTLLQRRFAPTEPSDATFVITVVQGPDAGRTATVHDALPGPLLVGKSPVCDLRLSDPEVSRRHASLEVRDREVHLVDLQSKNRTFVNGVCVESAFLRGGETLTMGRSLLRIELASQGDGAAHAVSHESKFGSVVGASREMRRLYSLCAKVAASTIPVVIEGETGTGKEALAEALHDASPRANGPFVVFDCTAVPANLMESELFGHERGAFTGAIGRHVGVFEQAEGGTLLIDEIGDLDLSLQPKLLRAIERNEFRRVGGQAPIRVNARIMAATRRDLDREVQAGRFRDDLFHRLAVARIELPPLRARRGDVALLARRFWSEMGGDLRHLPPELLTRWEAHPWPGNVRELRNAVARHLALGDDATLALGKGAEAGAPSTVPGHELERILALELPIARAREMIVEVFERRYLERVLAQHGSNVTRAAAASGIARRHFYRLLARSSG